MNPLDQTLKEFINPVLAPQDFRRRGRTFRRCIANGNFEIIAFTTETTPATVTAFYVQAGVTIARSERPWLSEDLKAEVAARLPGIADAKYVAQVMPPFEFSLAKLNGTPVRSAWAIKAAESVAALGNLLATALVSEVLPLVHDVAVNGGGDVMNTHALVTSVALPPFRELGPHS